MGEARSSGSHGQLILLYRCHDPVSGIGRFYTIVDQQLSRPHIHAGDVDRVLPLSCVCSPQEPLPDSIRQPLRLISACSDNGHLIDETGILRLVSQGSPVNGSSLREEHRVGQRCWLAAEERQMTPASRLTRRGNQQRLHRLRH